MSGPRFTIKADAGAASAVVATTAPDAAPGIRVLKDVPIHVHPDGDQFTGCALRCCATGKTEDDAGRLALSAAVEMLFALEDSGFVDSMPEDERADMIQRIGEHLCRAEAAPA